MKTLLSILIITLFVSCSSKSDKNDSFQISTLDFLRDIPAYTQDSLVNIVVEIPAGSNQKWEVDKATGFLEWERINEDSLRIVRYLPYPANYGMVPQTWLPTADGGDDDPLDIFLLGLSIERGQVVPARIVGVIKMLDKGLQDDKLIAVPLSGLFSEIQSMQQLKEHYPGVTDLLSLWLSSYKGGGKVNIREIGDELVAKEILYKASESFNAMTLKH